MLIVARKKPRRSQLGAFLFRCGKVAYSLGWLPPIYLRPAICRCSRRLHLPRQRVRKTKIYSWWHTPFLYLYRGGSVAHYTIVAEMLLKKYSFPCLLSSHKEKSVKGGHRPQRLPLILFFVGYNAGGKTAVHLFRYFPCASLFRSGRKKVKGLFYLQYELRPRASTAQIKMVADTPLLSSTLLPKSPKRK